MLITEFRFLLALAVVSILLSWGLRSITDKKILSRVGYGTT